MSFKILKLTQKERKDGRYEVHLSDICVQWPDTSCSHMTPTEHTDLRSGRETHTVLLREDKEIITLLLIRLEILIFPFKVVSLIQFSPVSSFSVSPESSLIKVYR